MTDENQAAPGRVLKNVTRRCQGKTREAYEFILRELKLQLFDAKTPKDRAECRRAIRTVELLIARNVPLPRARKKPPGRAAAQLNGRNQRQQHAI